MRTGRRLRFMVIGPTAAGKTTAAQMIADAERTVCTDISTLIVEEYAARAGVDIDGVLTQKSILRDELFRLGMDLESEAPGLLARRALKRGRVVCGVRRRSEFEACSAAFDLVIWIKGRGEIMQHDELDASHADVVVDNSGEVDQLRAQIWVLLDAARALA